jgi:uncharacterized protein (DUF2237 family)
MAAPVVWVWEMGNGPGRIVPYRQAGAGKSSASRFFVLKGEGAVSAARNVLGGELEVCSVSPLTGFIRNGACETGPEDLGSHTVCAQMTAAFLQYSRRHGNDLITPLPEYGFPGLKEGDRWCLSAARWLEAAEAGYAPPVILEATHARALQKIALADLEYHALQDPTA